LNEQKKVDELRNQPEQALQKTQKGGVSADEPSGTSQEPLDERSEVIRRQTEKIAQLQQDLDELGRHHQEARQEIKYLESGMEDISSVLESIKGSVGWKLVNKFRRTKMRLLPLGTVRRRLYQRLLTRFAGSSTRVTSRITSLPEGPEDEEWKPPTREFYRARLVALSSPGFLQAGKMGRFNVSVTNLSPHTWPATSNRPDQLGRVILSYRWRDHSGTIVQGQGEATPLPHDLGPQGSANVAMRIFAPFETGVFSLEISLVHGRHGWFDEKGSSALRVPVQVELPNTHFPRLPSCSIVIPVFNRAAFTKSCLLGIERSIDPERLPHEVIVVDNASIDGTEDLLRSWSGSRSNARVLSLGRNFGFARACNEGAQLARGHYLVFLNNDTLPTPGWLEKMIGLAEGDPQIGIVGCKLLYPEGRIQHIGVVFGKNRNPRHLYRGFQADILPAKVCREYQAVTGACLLLRREIFSSVGGMNEIYLNSYEDMDLCLKVRAKGYRIMVCTDSIVYHFEGMSEGRRAHDFRNAALFKARWADQIEVDLDRWHSLDGLQVEADEFEAHEGYEPRQERWIEALWKRVYSCSVPELR
jgi:GT2 family glycosyltransferase